MSISSSCCPFVSISGSGINILASLLLKSYSSFALFAVNPASPPTPPVVNAVINAPMFIPLSLLLAEETFLLLEETFFGSLTIVPVGERVYFLRSRFRGGIKYVPSFLWENGLPFPPSLINLFKKAFPLAEVDIV